MNETLLSTIETPPATDTGLLGAVVSLRTSVGDALNDCEFTLMASQTLERTEEADFDFLSFYNGFVMLGTPAQRESTWFSEKGCICPAQESIARRIADKHKLSLNEPPDVTTGYMSPWPEGHLRRHHFEFSRMRETVIIAHPRYLKIRVFVGKSAILYAWAARSPLLLGPELLEDLSALYRRH